MHVLFSVTLTAAVALAAPVRAGGEPARILGAEASGRRTVQAVTDPSRLSPVTRAGIERRSTFPHDLFAPGAFVPPLRTLRELAAARAVARTAQTEPETLAVVVLRVEFDTDAPGAASTGNGRFDLRTEAPEALVDPPPHNKAYFEAHGRALGKFYRTQSYGSLILDITVLPEGDTDAFRMSDLGDYGPWAVAQSAEVIRLAENFVTDALRAADESGTVDFGAFDAFLIAHAGSDFQSDINADSPFDVPSFTLTLGEPVELSTGSVDRALVIPETSSQDGLISALNGVLAHEFGHILGLPDLYNIFNGVPQVGWWSLMDSGENIAAIVSDPETGFEFEAQGIFPTSFDPWSKLQIFPDAVIPGFVGERYEDLLEGVQVNPEIPVVFVDPFEYFLVENRALDLDGNGFPFVRQDSLTSVFLGPTDDPERPGEGGEHEYDAVLPGGGVLIWHIDDRRVIPALQNRGEVNLSVLDRGVALEEADGVWDQGRFNFGLPADAFFEGNNTLFGPHTIPSSAANTGAYSGVTIEISGAPDRRMGVSITRELTRDGWPVVFEVERVLAHLTAVDGDGDGAAETFYTFTDPDAPAQFRSGIGAAAADGLLVDFETSLPDPTPLVSGSLPYMGLASSSAFRFESASPQPAVVGASVGGRVSVWDGSGSERASFSSPPAATPPVLVPDPPTGGPSWIVYGASGSLAVYDASGTLVETLPSATEGVPTAGPVVFGSALRGGTGSLLGAMGFAGTVEIYILHDPSQPILLDRIPAPGTVRHLLAGEVTAGLAPTVVAVTEDSILVAGVTGERRAAFPIPGNEGITLAPLLADLDRDGRAEIAAVTDGGTVLVLGGDGSPALGWPRSVTGGTPLSLHAADLDGDGDLDLLVADRAGLMHGFTGDGRRLPDYPRSVGPFGVTEALLVEEEGGDGLTWIAATEQAALLAVHFPDAAPLSGDWRSPGGNPEGLGAWMGEATATPGAPLPGLAEIPLMVYPNPSRHENVQIRFVLETDETAEVALYDVRGRELPGARLDFRGGPFAGENAVVWEVDGVAPGLYFCRLERRGPAGTRVDTARIALVQ
jgi:M6 family metalloprotease-like protein